MKQIECKWPKMLVTGVKVDNQRTIEDILLNTDPYLTTINKRSWGRLSDIEKTYYKESGFEYINKLENHLKDIDFSLDNDIYPYGSFVYYIQWRLQQKLNILNLDYCTTDRASSCFVYGHHGWIDADGNILFTDNIGKWPSTEEVLNEWKLIAERYHDLDLNITIFTGESSEEEAVPHFNIIVKDGIATYIDTPDLSVHVSDKLTSQYDQVNRSCSNRELNGIPLPMMLNIADTVKNELNEILHGIPDKGLNKIIIKYFKTKGYLN